MRGKGMALGMMFVITAVFVLEVVSGNFAMWCVGGALVGILVTSVYGYGVWLQIGERRAASQRALGSRKKKF